MEYEETDLHFFQGIQPFTKHFSNWKQGGAHTKFGIELLNLLELDPLHGGGIWIPRRSLHQESNFSTQTTHVLMPFSRVLTPAQSRPLTMTGLKLIGSGWVSKMLSLATTGVVTHSVHIGIESTGKKMGRRRRKEKKKDKEAKRIGGCDKIKLQIQFRLRFLSENQVQNSIELNYHGMYNKEG
ncbi:hypothetical protein DVH24_017009 [Malus domestica]|uniref:Uncharacterized protein n=1 Tax=Malus domestica TaxID=3750 RepID=A0A498IRI0_MALDO|nr:hypothetical protein DVH24_017009 [Malus domestica]